MEFPRTLLTKTISIDKLISFHYFEYAKGYAFQGEQHDFWEFLYVDRGNVEVQADDRILELQQGHIVFHKPDEFHTVRVLEHHKPPNLIVISFECSSSAMNYFQNKVIALTDRDRNLLSSILTEGFHAFNPPFNDPSIHALIRNPNAPFGSEQAISGYLEIFLINLVRAGTSDNHSQVPAKLSSFQKETADKQLVEQIVAFMRQNIKDSLSLDGLCKEFHLGKTRLKELFQSQLQSSVLEYFKLIKLEEAKSLIREKKYNLTEIGAQLGYASIHYFSRDFKRSTGMSPSEYAKTVKARSQN